MNGSRRRWLAQCGRGLLALLAGWGAGRALATRPRGRLRWQIDPRKCTQCGLCATTCVVQPSAVKCTHAFAMCGYCKLCFGYFASDAPRLDESAENQVCPTDALRRTFVEDPYFEYRIDIDRCIGCGLCVKGCNAFGNGSLYLQVMHDRCVNCHECRIAAACPAQAFVRVPESRPYLPKEELP